MIFVYLTVSLFCSSFLINADKIVYNETNYIKPLEYLTKASLAKIRDSSMTDAADLVKKMNSELSEAHKIYGDCEKTRKNIEDKHTQYNAEYQKLINDLDSEAIANTIGKYCKAGIKGCPDQKPRSDDVKDFAEKAAKLPKIAETIEAYNEKFDTAVNHMERSMKKIKENWTKTEENWIEVQELVNAWREAVDFAIDNEVSFDKVVAELEIPGLRKSLLESNIVELVDSIQDIVDDSGVQIPSIPKPRRRRNAVAGGKRSRRDSDLADLNGEWNCEGDWEDYCTEVSVPKALSEVETKVQIDEKELDQLHKELSASFDLFLVQDLSFFDRIEKFDEMLCNYTDLARWMEMLQFEDPKNPKILISSVKYDPDDFKFTQGVSNVEYKNIEMIIKGLKLVNKIEILSANVHRFGMIDVKAAQAIQNELKRQVCGDNSLKLTQLLNGKCSKECQK